MHGLQPDDPVGECIHGITAEWCSICKHPRKFPGPDEFGEPFTAKFEGWCYECMHPISPGERIRQVGERYGHTRCYRKG